MTRLCPHVLTHLTTLDGAELTGDCVCGTSVVKGERFCQTASEPCATPCDTRILCNGAAGDMLNLSASHRRYSVHSAGSRLRLKTFETRSTATGLKIRMHEESWELY